MPTVVGFRDSGQTMRSRMKRGLVRGIRCDGVCIRSPCEDRLGFLFARVVFRFVDRDRWRTDEAHERAFSTFIYNIYAAEHASRREVSFVFKSIKRLVVQFYLSFLETNFQILSRKSIATHAVC